MLKRYPAVFLNDLLPENRTKAEYQALCLAARKLADAGKIDSCSYWSRFSRPGFKALVRPGHEIKHPDDIHRLKPEERLKCEVPGFVTDKSNYSARTYLAVTGDEAAA